LALERRRRTTSFARYRMNSPEVIAETIDGEAVLVNLETGDYFSLDRVGAEIWNVLSAGATIEEIGSVLATRYGLDPDIARAAVVGLIEEMQKEGLVVEDGSLGGEGAIELLQATSQPDSMPRPFEPPVLRKYTDMQDQLMLDPIHEVDGTGWPNRV